MGEIVQLTETVAIKIGEEYPRFLAKGLPVNVLEIKGDDVLIETVRTKETFTIPVRYINKAENVVLFTPPPTAYVHEKPKAQKIPKEEKVNTPIEKKQENSQLSFF